MIKLLEGILRWLQGRSSPENPQTNLANPDEWLLEWAGGGTTEAGIRIDQRSALEFPPVYQAVRVLAGDIAQLPLHVYRRLPDGGRERAYQHPAYRLLRYEPNEYQTAAVFKETLMGHVLLWGYGCAHIERDGAGRPLSLTPLLPDRTFPFRAQNRLWIVTYVDSEPIKLPWDDVLYIPAYSLDGTEGLSPISLMRGAIAVGLAAQKYGASFFGQGAAPLGVLEHPGKLSQEAADRLRTSWHKIHSGLSGAHRVAVLEEGMKFQPLAINPQDAQFLDTRKFSVTDVARIFNLPPHKLNDLERATHSNIEQQSLEYLINSLMPWLVKWQEECDRKLLTELERRSGSHYCEFHVLSLLRADAKSRSEFYRNLLQSGVMSRNEVRQLENLNPLSDDERGDVTLVPVNMMWADQLIGTASSPDAKRAAAEMAASTEQLDEADRRLLADAFERLIRVESSAIRRAAAKKDQIDEWAAEWFARHEGRAVEVLAPVLEAICVHHGCPGAVSAPQVARQYCTESRALLQANVNLESAQESIKKRARQYADSWIDEIVRQARRRGDAATELPLMSAT